MPMNYHEAAAAAKKLPAVEAIKEMFRATPLGIVIAALRAPKS